MHLLLSVKNARIQPILIKVLSSEVGVNLSPFKDVWGSRIIFSGPSKVFTRANKDRQRELNHLVYSLYNTDILGSSSEYRVRGSIRLVSKSKMKISPLVEPIEN